jgi:hypothetical protein
MSVVVDLDEEAGGAQQPVAPPPPPVVKTHKFNVAQLAFTLMDLPPNEQSVRKAKVVCEKYDRLIAPHDLEIAGSLRLVLKGFSSEPRLREMIGLLKEELGRRNPAVVVFKRDFLKSSGWAQALALHSSPDNDKVYVFDSTRAEFEWYTWDEFTKWLTTGIKSVYVEAFTKDPAPPRPPKVVEAAADSTEGDKKAHNPENTTEQPAEPSQKKPRVARKRATLAVPTAASSVEEGENK